MDRLTAARYLSVERGVPSQRPSAWRSLLWAVLQVVAFALGMIIGPLALVVDLGRIDQRVGKAWVIGYLVTALLLTAAAWNVKEMLQQERQRSLEIVTEYSAIKASTEPVPFLDLIALHALRHDLDPALVAAVITRESRFDPLAVSPAGARGLMQVHPVTWRYLHPDSNCSGRHQPPACGEDCIFDPEANIAVGTSYLRRLFDEFDGDIVLAFAAYNAGPTAVRRYAGGALGQSLPPYRETRLFVADVISYWQEYRHDPPPVEMDPARLTMLQQTDTVLARVAFGYWLLFLVWAMMKIPWG